MKRNWLIVLGLVFSLALIVLIVRAKFFAKAAPGALQIATTPKAMVFLDGSQVGLTPFFNDKIIAGEHTVKLVPETTQDKLVSWEGKVEIASNILTVINRELAASEAFSSGEILSLERIGKRDVSSLAVVSIPDQAVVKIGGEPRGFAPVLVEDLIPGDYQVIVSSPGYQERTVSAHTVAGYKLTVNVKLAQKIEGIEEATPSAEKKEEVGASPKPSPIPLEKPYIKVKETPTGWLRVRTGPLISATEAAKIKPGEMYPYLNEEKNGWYKIEYEEGEEGWVSGVYVELVE